MKPIDIYPYGIITQNVHALWDTRHVGYIMLAARTTNKFCKSLRGVAKFHNF